MPSMAIRHDRLVYVSLGDCYHASKECTYLKNVRFDNLMGISHAQAWTAGYWQCPRCWK
jgi:hypothetical protein